MKFQQDIEKIREQAREHMMRGPVTTAYAADPRRVCDVLNEILATEIVCALRYRNNHYAALDLGEHRVAEEFLEHAAEEETHQEMLSERISQLGGVPDFNPSTLTERSHAEYVTSKDLRVLLTENLVAERVAIATYAEVVRWLGDGDPTTRRVMETILAQEEEHADDLVDLIRRAEARA